jgi:hypothetical protein
MLEKNGKIQKLVWSEFSSNIRGCSVPQQDELGFFCGKNFAADVLPMI